MSAAATIARRPASPSIDLPDFGMPDREPEIPASTLPRTGSRALRARAAARGYDRLVVYADREHSANLAWLTGFDPRFEEALLVVGPRRRPGDPGRQRVLRDGRRGAAADAPRPVPGPQPARASPAIGRGRWPRSSPTRAIGPGAGSASSAGRRTPTGSTIEVPAFIVDELRRLTGRDGLVENATDLLIDAADGLRVVNEVDGLAALEWASCQTSNGVRRLLSGLRPGMTEREAVRLLDWNGTPLSCHLMLTAGPRASLGLLSPGDRPIERGDRFTVAFGIWGALTCRAGFVVEDAAELPAPIADYVERLVGPYFEAIAEWYEALHVGQTGGVLHDIIDAPPRRPVLRHLPQPGPPDRARRVGQLADLRRLDDRAPVGDGLPGRHHPGDRDGLLHDQHRGRHRARRRVAPRRPSRPPTRRPGRGSRPAAGSWPRRSASTSTRTSCRSRTSRPTCRRSCSGPTGR